MDFGWEMQEFKPLTGAKSLPTTAYEMKCQATSKHKLWESTFDLLLHYLYKLQGNKTWWPFQAFFLDLYRQLTVREGSIWLQLSFWGSPPKTGTPSVTPEAVS